MQILIQQIRKLCDRIVAESQAATAAHGIAGAAIEIAKASVAHDVLALLDAQPAAAAEPRS